MIRFNTRPATHRVASSMFKNRWSTYMSSMRFKATAPPEVASVPKANRSVANWLYFSAGVVGGVVWFGGVTRLTDAGLSISYWKPGLAGMKPPLNEEEWEKEFDYYKEFPEYQQNTDMTMDDFKWIFFWEWSHRILARSVGVVYGVPLIYYMARGRFRGNAGLLAALWGILGLGGAQGLMGWYMVSSGLDAKLLEERRKVTVSSYRLASHLVLAFMIYGCMLRAGYGLKLPKAVDFAGRSKVQLWSRISFSAMFLTAISGAFVAGMDAGLLYNHEFPFMSGGIVPPKEDLFALEPVWRNFFENGATAQTTHRILASVTTACIAGLNVACSTRGGRVIPSRVKRTLQWVNGALVLQVSLGMWTILSEVDVPVAATHQIGALLLLATLIRMCTVVGGRGIVLV